MFYRRICCLTLAALMAQPAGAGGTPLGTVFTYQGVLKSGGLPANGTYHLRFQLWDALSGGAQVGGDIDEAALAITDGQFTASLDFGAGAFDGSARWLQVQVVTNGGNTVTTLVPRQPVNPTPYALYSEKTGPLTTAVLPAEGDWALSSGLNLDSNTLHIDAANNRVGIGTNTPTAALDIAGTARMTGFQLSTGASTGKVLRSDGNGAGSWQDDGLKLPFVAATNAASPMVELTNTNTFGGTGIVVHGGGIGLFSEGISTGLQANATGSTGTSYGVAGTSYSSTGRGVAGFAANSSGTNYGVYGQCSSSNGAGVYGLSLASGFATGVWGQTNSTGGVGVYGRVTASSGATMAVLGECFSSAGWAVYAAGRFAASGTKAFRIDHPDDPANKYLNHYCAESPEVINFYSGKVVLDSKGCAVVELPAYFAKINRDPRYTLTAIGAAMPNLHVAQEIDDALLMAGAASGLDESAPRCSFQIAGGAPAAKVSWEVKAVRNDRWVQQHGAPIEESKVGQERGLYQHPELYGQPASMGLYHRATAE